LQVVTKDFNPLSLYLSIFKKIVPCCASLGNLKFERATLENTKNFEHNAVWRERQQRKIWGDEDF
jgi:hypothetical protein